MRVTQTKERILLNNAAWRAMHKTCSTQRNINYILNVKKPVLNNINRILFAVGNDDISRRMSSDSGISHNFFYTIKKK